MSRWIFALSTLSLFLLFSGAQASVQWNVLSSDESGLRVEILVDGAHLVDGRDTGDAAYRRVQIDGMSLGGDIGLPLLPAASRWIVLPPLAEISVHVDTRETSRLGNALLEPHATGGIDPNPSFDRPRSMERLIQAPGYLTFRRRVEETVVLRESTWIGRQRMVALAVAPVIYDAPTGEIQVLTRAIVDIRFSGATRGSAASTADQATMGVAAGALNAEMAGQWRGLPPQLDARVELWKQGMQSTSVDLAQKRGSGVDLFDATQLESDEIRIQVPTSGLWRVHLSDLIAAHGLPLDFPRSHLRLYQKRPTARDDAGYPRPLAADVPLQFIGDPDEGSNLSNSDVVLFYGLGIRDDTLARTIDGDPFPRSMQERPDNYNAGNVYWLAVADPGAGSWARMAHVSLAPSSGSPQPSFAVQDHFEEDLGYQDNVLTTAMPRFHWNESRDPELNARFALRPFVSDTTFDFRFSLVRAVPVKTVPRNIELTINQSATATTIPLTTVDVNPRIYDSLRQHTELIPAAGSGLAPGFADLNVIRDVPNAFLNTFLGSIELRYDALYEATSDIIDFDAGVTGVDVDLEITGFSRSDLTLIEITDPQAPSVVDLAAANIVSDGDFFKVSIRAPQQVDEKRRFVALQAFEADRLRGSRLSSDPVGDLFAATPPLQAIAIGPAEFEAGLQPWLDWRRSNDRFGWDYGYVDVQQIYDEFAGGMKSPAAIKEFIYYYHLAHEARAIVLVGDGNENSREVGQTPARDVMPPSLHIQETFGNEELLASDKWFVTFDFLDAGILINYPILVNKGPDLMIGRLPVNDTDQLSEQVAKILAYESPSVNDDWRNRTLWIADDEYSTSYIGSGAGSCYSATTIEEEFAISQAYCASIFNLALDGSMVGETWNIGDDVAALRVADPNNAGCFLLNQTRANVEVSLVPRVLQRMSEGHLVISYQGHAAYNVFAHETILQQAGIRSLNNHGKPFVFFGMGCHVSDFLQEREGRDGRPMGEELMMLPTAGAIASYGSSGFEFLTPNSQFMRLISETFFRDARGSSLVLDADEFGSQLILAEALAQSEADIVAAHPTTTYREMMAQYNLLGDPLLRLDAAAPRVALEADSVDLSSGDSLVPAIGQRNVQINLALVDESSVGGVRLFDEINGSEVRNHDALLTLDPSADPRSRIGSLSLPIVAQAYSFVVEASDQAYPVGRPRRLSFDVPMPITLFLDDAEIASLDGAIGSGQSAAIRIEVVSPISLTAEEISVSIEGADLSGFVASTSDPDNRAWSLDFNVRSTAARQLITMTLAGAETTIGQAPTGGGGPLALREHYPFPNPSRGPMRIVGSATEAVDEVRLSIFDLTGRGIYSELLGAQGDAEFSVEWDGLDAQGDELANGVYLYRLEIRGASSSVRSGMGRLVVMR